MLIRLCLVVLLATQPAFAHEGRPLFLQLTQLTENRFELAWQLPPQLSHAQALTITLAQHGSEPSADGDCRAINQISVSITYPSGHRQLQCPQGMDTAQLLAKLKFGGQNPGITSLVRLVDDSGHAVSMFFPPGETDLLIKIRAQNNSFFNYLQQGLLHIASGYDHLLFVFCLVLLCATWQRLVLCISGFTIAHSITLGLAAFEFIWVPISAVEAVIALSIAFLAAEIVRNDRRSLTWRHPIAAAAAFGLLHGFGFASALLDIGLPNQETLIALLAFNLGVELGQLGFVLLLIPLLLLARRAPFDAHKPSAYIIGILAMFWTLQRILT